VAWPEEALEQVQPDVGTAVVLLTHDDKFDFPMIRGTLETDASYIGLLGSRRNQERRRALLLEDGVTEEQLDRISGPCGLDVGADSPAETALSILAEILSARAGRSGGSLKASPHRIHADPVAANKK
jgi:xanthine dehydrogenase accessory factor